MCDVKIKQKQDIILEILSYMQLLIKIELKTMKQRVLCQNLQTNGRL